LGRCLRHPRTTIVLLTPTLLLLLLQKLCHLLLLLSRLLGLCLLILHCHLLCQLWEHLLYHHIHGVLSNLRVYEALLGRHSELNRQRCIFECNALIKVFVLDFLKLQLLLGLLSLVIIATAFFFLRGRKLHSLTTAGLMMMLGGAAGNMVDRLIHGAVPDMIEVLFVQFAIFNVADVFLCTGCGLVILRLLFGKETGE
jgi:hypothetical protein